MVDPQWARDWNCAKSGYKHPNTCSQFTVFCAQAIEDAYVLTQCLVEGEQTNTPIPERFQRYYDRRSKRTRDMVDLAWFLGALLIMVRL